MPPIDLLNAQLRWAFFITQFHKLYECLLANHRATTEDKAQHFN